MLFCLGLGLGLFVPWYFYIQHVTNSIIHETWDVPSVVYARPLELYKGQQITPKALTFELETLGYQEVSGTPQLGQYQAYNNSFDIYSKGFNFPDGTQKPQRIKLTINNKAINQISHQIIRLEPKVMGHFFSSAFENRHPMSLEHMPSTLVQGIQAVEDREFKHHNGVDWWGISRAMVKNIMAGKIVQGGSTITQQLVKNKLEYDQQSWLRKLHEALAATLIETKLSKKDILQMYLNEIYFGQDGKVAIHGVVEAASFYFAKPVERLAIHEQAVLVGIIKGPSWYNPIRNPSRALKRRNVVLKVWHETGIITQASWAKAKEQPLGLSQHRRLKTDYDDYMGVVKRQLKDQFSDEQLKQDGLKIFTNLDPYVQYVSSQTARRTRQWLNANMEAALVISDAKTGALLALTGSQSAHSQFNRALLSRRQIGSLIKPFLFLAALEKLPDFDLNAVLEDKALSINTQGSDPWQPKNWDQQSRGEISAREALVDSRNQATVYLGLKLGLNNLVSFLERLGLNINRAQHPSLFLGAIELTPFDVQHLYTIFSSQGQVQKINAIRFVSNINNQLLSRSKSTSSHAIALNSINSINDALHQITTHGSAQKITNKYALPGYYFGKTGTTNKGKDSWFSGFDDRYLATVWVGRDDNKATPYSGSSGALVLWSHLFKNL
nr:transglycosylase domain-containing protein [Marinicella rhabdoformis]